MGEIQTSVNAGKMRKSCKDDQEYCPLTALGLRPASDAEDEREADSPRRATSSRPHSQRDRSSRRSRRRHRQRGQPNHYPPSYRSDSRAVSDHSNTNTHLRSAYAGPSSPRHLDTRHDGLPDRTESSSRRPKKLLKEGVDGSATEVPNRFHRGIANGLENAETLHNHDDWEGEIIEAYRKPAKAEIPRHKIRRLPKPDSEPQAGTKEDVEEQKPRPKHRDQSNPIPGSFSPFSNPLAGSRSVVAEGSPLIPIADHNSPVKNRLKHSFRRQEQIVKKNINHRSVSPDTVMHSPHDGAPTSNINGPSDHSKMPENTSTAAADFENSIPSSKNITGTLSRLKILTEDHLRRRNSDYSDN